ncbi:19829_t:CDS:2 [Racocetra persica]|uniref:19829_t:CDS:1 n=1 Tax=Racocetra persica TaxID=160502 RepID=A0ACA9NJP2_9GLOM|nr:19829_t:CDS:2 [Racocetra persica]
MSRIRRNEISNVTLSRINYDNYRQKFPSFLKQGVSFSNQLNLHEQLRTIKDENHFTNEFFMATKIYTNNQSKKINSDHNACQITIDVDDYSSLTDTSDSGSEHYATDDEQSNILQQSSSLNNEQLINNEVLKVQTESNNIQEKATNNCLQPKATNNCLQPAAINFSQSKFSNDRQSQSQNVYVCSQNNALKIENYVVKSELSNLKAKYTVLEKENTHLKEKYKSQEIGFRKIIKDLENTIKSLEAELRNNKIKFKAERKELVTELNLLKNKIKEAETRQKQLENKINKIIEDQKELRKKSEKEKQELQNQVYDLQEEKIKEIVDKSKGGCN